MEDDDSFQPRLDSPEPMASEGAKIKDLLDELEDSMDDVGAIRRQYMSKIMPENEEFNSSQVPIDTISKREVQDLIESVPRPMVQKPLQPGSSPTDEDNRFLCWNNTGIIRAQSSNDDQSIDVMFHDTERHLSVNFKNEDNYTFGSLSEDCIAVGSNGKYGTGPSTLHGINLLENNRDHREWEIELPAAELIEGLAVGAGFVALATDTRCLRLLTNAGMQSYLFTLPGQILCMTAYDRQLMIIYHNGAGHSDDQNLSMFVYYIDLFNNIVRQTHRNVPVGLSKRSPLAWAGFSDEGTPCTYDYSGMFRIYQSELGKTWVPLLDLRELTTSALDHYFAIGVSEISQVVRAVKCRRSRFPEFQAGTAELLGFSLPMCDKDTDKGKLEEEHVRLRLAEMSYKRLGNEDGYTTLVGSASENNEKLLVNTVLRLFAIYLKEQKEDAAKNLVYMIPKAHMSKLPEFAWKINQPQYFIDALNRAIEEREQLDHDLVAAVTGRRHTLDAGDEVRSVSSSQNSFGRDLRRELAKSNGGGRGRGTANHNNNNNNNNNNESPNKLKPLPLDKLVTNQVNRIIESNVADGGNKSGESSTATNKRPLTTTTTTTTTTDADESGDENDAKRAKRTKYINYNLFSKKKPTAQT